MMPRQHADDKRLRVERMDRPVIRDGVTLWWRYSIPLTHGALIGWCATQPAALDACRAHSKERVRRGWT